MKNVLVRAGLITMGIGLMYLESSYQPEPGVGFAGAMMLFITAALWGSEA